MADAYGMLTFAKSDDCIFDAEKMKDVLNQFEWDNSGARWINSDNNDLYISNYGFDRPQYPTAIPKGVAEYVLFSADGKFIRRNPDEMSEDDWGNLAGSEDVPISLDRLSSMLSPLLQSGWIEIACVANEKARYVYFESLRIYADGRVSLKNICSGPFTAQIDVAEEYSPQEIAA